MTYEKKNLQKKSKVDKFVFWLCNLEFLLTE